MLKQHSVKTLSVDQHSVKSVLQADLLTLENDEQAALSITIPIPPDLETTSTLTTFRTHLYYSHSR